MLPLQHMTVVPASASTLPDPTSLCCPVTVDLADLALHCSLAFPVYDATQEQLLLSAPIQGSGEPLREAHHLPSSNPTSGTSAFIVSEGQSDTTRTKRSLRPMGCLSPKWDKSLGNCFSERLYLLTHRDIGNEAVLCLLTEKTNYIPDFCLHIWCASLLKSFSLVKSISPSRNLNSPALWHFLRLSQAEAIDPPSVFL